MHPSMYNRPGQSPPGLDFNKPGTKLKLFGSQGGPMVAMQSGELRLSDGTVLPQDVREIEAKGIRLSADARRAVASLKADRLIEIEQQQSAARIREIQEAEFARLEKLRVEHEAIENQRWTIPDLPIGGHIPGPPAPMPSPFEEY